MQTVIKQSGGHKNTYVYQLGIGFQATSSQKCKLSLHVCKQHTGVVGSQIYGFLAANTLLCLGM